MPDPHPGPAQRAGLASVASPDGALAIVAMDQRNALRRMLTAAGRPACPGELRSFKAEVVAALSPAAIAVLAGRAQPWFTAGQATR